MLCMAYIALAIFVPQTTDYTNALCEVFINNKNLLNKEIVVIIWIMPNKNSLWL